MSMILRSIFTLAVAAASLVLLYGSPGLLPGGDESQEVITPVAPLTHQERRWEQICELNSEMVVIGQQISNMPDGVEVPAATIRRIKFIQDDLRKLMGEYFNDTEIEI